MVFRQKIWTGDDWCSTGVYYDPASTLKDYTRPYLDHSFEKKGIIFIIRIQI